MTRCGGSGSIIGKDIKSDDYIDYGPCLGCENCRCPDCEDGFAISNSLYCEICSTCHGTGRRVKDE